VTDSYVSVTLFMDLETRGVISSNRLTGSPRRFVYYILHLAYLRFSWSCHNRD